jgi:hypothetical protein
VAQRSRLSTGLSGVAGEYFVAAELSRRGYIASITLRNTRGVDRARPLRNSNIPAHRNLDIPTHPRQNPPRIE